MDTQLLFSSIGSHEAQLSASQLAIDNLIPYVILIVNYILFQLMRSLVDKLLFSSNYLQEDTNGNGNGNKWHWLKLFLHELISTCELCADCAELNVVYEKHGSYAYGASLFLLTYLWIDSFGEAQTSPGYLIEDYFLVRGNELLKSGDAYARFIGQSVAMPLAWRLATLYWKYELIGEHRTATGSIGPDCKSSLTTSTLNGFLIELLCCLICRLAELIGHKLLERQYLSQRVVSASCSFICSLLVVLSLELSGGYFNPILAASLEYGCKGINLQQHALVFWLGPLLGHLLARLIFKSYDKNTGHTDNQKATLGAGEIDCLKQSVVARTRQQVSFNVKATAAGNGQANSSGQQQQLQSQSRRQTRSGGNQRKRKSADKID